MSKKNSHISDDELYETTEQLVDSSVNPDGITIDSSTEDSKKVTVETDGKTVIPDSETPVDEILEVEQTPIPEETITGDKNPITDVIEETPVTDWKSVLINPKTPVDKTPVITDS